MIEMIIWSVAAALFLATIAGTLELCLLTFAALMPQRARGRQLYSAKDVRIAVVIPAHNEESVLTATIESLMACTDPPPAADVLIVADNCSDNTAEVARELGCTVLERVNPIRRGKGYALEHAFQYLADKGYTGYVVVDADWIVEDNFFQEFRNLFARGADGGQCITGVLNAGANARTRLLKIAWLAFNFLRPLARQRLGLSAGILGTGFALRSDIV